FVLPSGPLRAPIHVQLPFADQIIVVGQGDAGDSVVRLASRAAKPVSRALLSPRNIGKVKGQNVMAFAGIADPAKFYTTLAEMGANIIKTRSYPDHHVFLDSEIKSLMDDAGDLLLITTEKDAVRFQGSSVFQQELRSRAAVIPVQIRLLDDTVMKRALDEALKRFKAAG
ncbi:MAG: tetraacyldisaccharide 4'-kinase, partial [Notoacmeibacter sp.]